MRETVDALGEGGQKGKKETEEVDIEEQRKRDRKEIRKNKEKLMV